MTNNMRNMNDNHILRRISLINNRNGSTTSMFSTLKKWKDNTSKHFLPAVYLDDLNKSQLLNIFIEKAVRLDFTCSKIGYKHEIWQDFQKNAKTFGIDPNNLKEISIAPESLRNELGSETPYPLKFSTGDINTAVCIIESPAAIAETGSFCTASSKTFPSSMTFVPDILFVLVHEDVVFPYLEDAYIHINSQQNLVPRTITIVSGPSKSADIAHTPVRGAHGPRHVHILIYRHK